MRNYLAAHWRGEHSLARAFWINGVLVGFAFGLVAGLLSMGIQALGSSILSLVLALIIFILSIVVAVWVFVGQWRSARHHIKATGRKFWARVVQFIVILGVLQVTISILLVVVSILQGLGVVPDGGA